MGRQTFSKTPHRWTYTNITWPYCSPILGWLLPINTQLLNFLNETFLGGKYPDNLVIQDFILPIQHVKESLVYNWDFGHLAPILRSDIFQIYKVKMVIAIRSFCQRIHKNRTLPYVIVFFDPTSESSYEPDSGDFVEKTPDCRKISKIFDDIENII